MKENRKKHRPQSSSRRGSISSVSITSSNSGIIDRDSLRQKKEHKPQSSSRRGSISSNSSTSTSSETMFDNPSNSESVGELIGYCISLNALHTRRIKLTDASANLGSSKRNKDIDLATQIHDMKKAKKIIQNWARQQLERIIVKQAVKERMKCQETGQLVGTFKDIKHTFACDGRYKIGKQVWFSLYHGAFLTSDWDLNLEKRFMDEHGITYREIHEEKMECNKRTKGCILKLIVAARNSLIFTLNRAAGQTHGNKVCITRPKYLIKEQDNCTGKQTRRDKTKFYDWCYRKSDDTPHTKEDDVHLSKLKSMTDRREHCHNRKYKTSSKNSDMEYASNNDNTIKEKENMVSNIITGVNLVKSRKILLYR